MVMIYAVTALRSPGFELLNMAPISMHRYTKDIRAIPHSVDPLSHTCRFKVICDISEELSS